MKRILIMAGGTGGHIFPGLAVADYFCKQGIAVHWLGASQGLETELVKEAGYPLHVINICGLRGKGARVLAVAPWRICAAIFQARQIIKAVQPDVAIGMGGFVSGPGGIASWLGGCPLVIHEQNAYAGLTNRLLGYVAKRVLEGFPASFQGSGKIITVGNPVRMDIERLGELQTRRKLEREANQKRRLRLLVLGGSLGAQVFNELLPAALALIDESLRPEIWHQTGRKHEDTAKRMYEQYAICAKLSPFISDMAAAYRWADMVLCRAGALTVAELCAAGLGAILIPYPHAVDDHQTANAEFMVKAGAALCVQQAELTRSKLALLLQQFIDDPEKRSDMADAAYQLRRVDVPATIFKICQEVCF